MADNFVRVLSGSYNRDSRFEIPAILRLQHPFTGKFSFKVISLTTDPFSSNLFSFIFIIRNVLKFKNILCYKGNVKFDYTENKYLIESKKLFVWSTFFDVKKCFVLMKQNLFDSNKISLDQINICSNQINFCLKSNKLYLWPYINALISLLSRKINLIQINIYLVQRYFVWMKQILFHLNKSFL